MTGEKESSGYSGKGEKNGLGSNDMSEFNVALPAGGSVSLIFPNLIFTLPFKSFHQINEIR